MKVLLSGRRQADITETQHGHKVTLSEWRDGKWSALDVAPIYARDAVLAVEAAIDLNIETRKL